MWRGEVLELGKGFGVEYMDDQEVKENLILRRFKLTKDGKSKIILQYQVLS